jgi:hypothetical protein
MIGESAHHRAVVIPVIGPAVGLHDGPVCEIAENQVGRVFDTVLPLRACTATQGCIAAADDRVSADIVIRFDNDD